MGGLMAYPTYPVALPCPQSGPLRSIERRDLTEVSGPRAAAPYQRAGQAQQGLTFRIRFDLAPAWLAWWSETLEQGGAWFIADWPHPTGQAVPRRFISPPSWSLVAGWGWDVTIDAEVLSLDQMPAATEVPLWLDNFTGEAGTPINEHAQDINYFDGIWSTSEGLARLDGNGNVYPGTDNISTEADTEFYYDPGPVELANGWRLELDATPVPFYSADTYPMVGVELEDEDGNHLLLYIEPGEDHRDPVYVIVSYGGAEAASVELPWGRKQIVLTQSDAGFTLRINGDLFGPFEFPIPIRPVRGRIFIPRVQSPTELSPHDGIISRVALYGVIVGPEPF